MLDTIASHFPAGRIGTPEEVAAGVIMFLTENARWCNGQSELPTFWLQELLADCGTMTVLRINGGQHV